MVSRGKLKPLILNRVAVTSYRQMIVVNGAMPGPVLRATKGDELSGSPLFAVASSCFFSYLV